MALFGTTEANAVYLEAVCKGTFANMLAASLRETPAYLKQFAVFYVKMVTFSVFMTITHKFLCVRNAAGHRRAYSSEHNVIRAGKEQFVSRIGIKQRQSGWSIATDWVVAVGLPLPRLDRLCSSVAGARNCPRSFV